MPLRPFFQLMGVYDTGLAGVAVSETGELASHSSTGIRAGWGLSGSHVWKRTTLGVDYRGSITRYERSTTVNMINQSLMLGLTHRLTRHSTLTFNQNAGMYSRDFGLLTLTQTVPFDPSTSYIPTTDFFDNRTYYTTSQVGFSLQKSSRLSFFLAGTGSAIRRRSANLYETAVGTAYGDVQYRLTRHSTIGSAYTYAKFKVSNTDGATDAHNTSGTFSLQVGRRAEFSGSAGLLRLETKFLRNIPVDPVIGALLGITNSTQIRHTRSWTSTGSGRLSYKFSTGVAFATGGRALVPGNGLFLTSFMTSYTAGYLYTGLRRWSFTSQVSRQQASSVQNVTGKYNTTSANASIARSFLGVHWTAAYSVRRYDSPDFVRYNRLIHQASFGLAYSPGDIPLRLW